MKTRSYWPLLGGLALVIGFSPGASAQTPRLEAGSILVQSIPSGLKVYFAPDMASTEGAEEGWVSLVETHSTISDANLKGVTPVLIRDVGPGKYHLGISSVLLVGENGRRETDPMLDAAAFVSSTKPAMFGEPFKAISGAVIYSISRESTEAQRVIVLAVPSDAGLDQLDSVYPREASVSFDEAQYAAALKEETKTMFTDEQAAKVIDLLKRGGKVAVGMGDLRLLSEILPDGTWTIQMQVRPPQKR